MSLCLDRKPLEQLAEHCVHSIQAPQAPSKHPLRHDSALHEATSSLSCGTQSAPPFRGQTATPRPRLWLPPPQVAEQADHACQSPHRQSACPHLVSRHEPTSSKGDPQPEPSGEASVCTMRFRDLVPAPHREEHADHAIHSESWQLTGPCAKQGPSLHAATCRSEVLPHLPPMSFTEAMFRSRYFCPPKQDLSQALHSVQALSVQSSGAVLQPCISLNSEGHSAPPLIGDLWMERLRYCCGCVRSHTDQELQSPT
mmetsp:Transcript_40498/g.128158  ORF Transcript_40498/g.128158 Transcript_40498/m.128158 type:complete len:255 (+) Transcript_40498:3204-3968(+)